MNMPGFTAETSLYKTNGLYQTSRPAVTSVAKTIRAFHPAAEVIEVHGCPPGFTMIGAPPDDWYCFPDPLTEPGSGGGGGTPAGVGGGGFGSPTGRPGRPKRPPSKPPKTPPKKYAPKRGEPCYVEHSVTSGDVTITDVDLNGTYFTYYPGKWACAAEGGSTSRECNVTWTDGDGNKNTDRCYNGHNAE